MECLYKAVDADGRVLGLILRPYLNQLFRGSHENCWFLQEWKKKTDLSEVNRTSIQFNKAENNIITVNVIGTYQNYFADASNGCLR